MASQVEVTVDYQARRENDETYRRQLSLLFKSLRMQAISNMEYFQVGKGYNHDRFHGAFHLIHDHLDRGIEPGVEYFLSAAYLYDFSPVCPGNGFRSIIKVIHKCCLHLLQLTRHITVNRESFLFRAGHYSRELNAYVNNLGQLRACLHYLQKLMGYCPPGELFPSEEELSQQEFAVAEQLMLEVESLNQEAFYGRCLGFQYCDSMTKPLTTINLMMASFSDGYAHNSTMMKLASSVLGGSKYLLDPELRAQQVVKVTRNSDVKFAKAFWSIAENSLMHNLPLMVCPPVQLDKVIMLPPESFELPTRDGSGRTARITPPCAHTGPGPVHTRLISYRLHEGQDVLKSKDLKTSTPSKNQVPKSTGLIIHCHGGGFVAQSSASHEMYLRSWAKDTGAPILSVDYSLAPEYPFPRQLEEIFYAYCWALKNLDLLGTTGERICIVGDSAGGNMAIAVAMRAASYDIRVPDAVLSVYGCMLVRYIPSSSRILSLMDALLPMGILGQCLAAYAGVADNDFVFPPTMQQMFSHPKTPSEEHAPPVAMATDSPMETEGAAGPRDYPAKIQRHKSTGSGDSGYHDNIQDGGCGNRGNEKGDTNRGDTNVVEGDNVGISVIVGEDTNTSANHDSQKISDNEQINGAPPEQEIDRSLEKSPSVSPSRSGLALDLSKINPFGRIKSESRRMFRSPSSPTFSHTHSNGLASPPGGDPEKLLAKTPDYAKVRHFAQSPSQKLGNMPISKNPYMSPYLAKKHLLKGLCPVYLVACHLDPLLDDSVMFARKLRAMGKVVHLDILSDLPHGFLNFVLISQEAKHGSDLCVARLKEILNVEDTPVYNDEDWEDLSSEAQ